MKRTICIFFCILLLYGCKKDDKVLLTSVELTSLTHTAGIVTVSWSATNAAAIQSYSIERRGTSASFVIIQTVDSGLGNTYSHPAPSPGTYYYRIMASTADSSYYSNIKKIVL